ncbi:TIGR04255 family protein [Phenylobacterium montanum]|uniref:TIGR04255 family protein n=1 Tax=Phenylobacterium montanum TaxID=2823693 RepID=A0A975ITK9_9CAUL|nr:TIGR04255 family protein [Caulobacter sp. S6]QUD86972.1 TIGR04255 family protein [Caulobacter sp. S6]
MPFEPINERHAIREVAFAFQFARPFNVEEIDTLAKDHDAIRSELPKLQRPMFLQFFVGPDASQTLNTPPGGANFESYKRDGTLDWRLSVTNNLLTVNCLTYTRWVDVWARAKHYISFAMPHLVKEDNAVSDIGLQYIDEFAWSGPIEEYDNRLILKAGGDNIPNSILGRGPLWHIHQGWFEPRERPLNGRLLNRMHVDALLVDDKHIVRFDSTLSLDIDEADRPTKCAALINEDGIADQVLSELHAVNKAVLGSYITDDLAKEIELVG